MSDLNVKEFNTTKWIIKLLLGEEHVLGIPLTDFCQR